MVGSISVYLLALERLSGARCYARTRALGQARKHPESSPVWESCRPGLLELGIAPQKFELVHIFSPGTRSALPSVSSGVKDRTPRVDLTVEL
jgi:hypothetical protein